MKINEIIRKIEAFHPPLDYPDTCDTVKHGDPGRECTGVAVTCFASADVIRKAEDLGANFIICHEPTFYSHTDDTEWLMENSIYLEKKRLLEKKGIVIWRDHDHIHGEGPNAVIRKYDDMIYFGIMKVLNWEKHLINDPNKPLLYRLPETTVGELAQELIDKLHLNGMRVTGDINARVSTVLICEHIFGRERDSDIINKTDLENIDALIPLEIVDWTLSEYVLDSVQLGRPRAILSVGHFNLEEAGMKYMAEWLPGVIGNSVPVHYVQSGDMFRYIV